ncbi:cytochrome P450 [Streptomyces galbus]|uniref:Cytochrome P450 n=1 Tax=Streptomyces galbus TaxID=33898 RepID=A0A4U5XBK6_STRGB|nr:cytochrome P450 [Streptomyces galbus]TKT11016.1 cytochrome P450 [Streptomyces galbus]GHD45651.1 putative cytochrome P450 126 [Streptomyces galbus]
MTTDHELPDVLGGFDLSDQTRFADGVPYDLFARLREEAPVLFHPGARTADGDGFWVLTGHADIVAAAASPDFSAQGGGGRAGGGSHLDDLPVGVHAGVLFAMMDNPRHDLIRRLLRPAVTGEVAQGLAAPLREIAADLLHDALADGGRVDFMKDLSEPYALRAVSLLLGAPRADWDRLADWGRRNLGFTNRLTGTPDAGSAETFQAMSAYFKELLDHKRDTPAQDLASVLALGALEEGHGEAPMTDQERDANATLILITGFEQPRNTIAGGVLALAQHPDQWQALRKDRSLLPRAIEEILRWVPPNPYNRRTATRDVELHGHHIKAGDKVTFWWPSANRDEEAFDHASVFDISRSHNPHLSFGTGTHFCLGEQVARLEIQLFLEALLDTVAEVRLTGPVVHAPNNKHTVILDMPVELVPTSPTG